MITITIKITITITKTIAMTKTITIPASLADKLPSPAWSWHEGSLKVFHSTGDDN